MGAVGAIWVVCDCMACRTGRAGTDLGEVLFDGPETAFLGTELDRPVSFLKNEESVPADLVWGGETPVDRGMLMGGGGTGLCGVNTGPTTRRRRYSLVRHGR